MTSYKSKQPVTFHYETLKPRFRFMPATPLVRVIPNEQIEIRPRNNSNKVYVIPLAELTTMRAVAIAVQHLAAQHWTSKEILMSFVSVAMCNVAEPNPKAVDISKILR